MNGRDLTHPPNRRFAPLLRGRRPDPQHLQPRGSATSAATPQPPALRASSARGRIWRFLLAAVVAAAEVAVLAAASGPEAKAKPRKGMELPPELQVGATEVKVTYRKVFTWPNKTVAEVLRFEPYRAVDFRPGWIKGTSSGSPLVFGDGWTFHWTATEETHRYSFDVVVPGDRRWSCSCAAAYSTSGTFFSGEHMGVGIPGHGQSRLACVLTAPDDPVEWRFELGVDLEPALLPVKTAVGWVRHGSDEVTLKGTERMAKWGRAAGRLVGLVVTISDRPVAAIDLVGNPAVIFGAELPAAWRDPVAAVGAAALLYPDRLDPFPSAD